MNETPDRLGFEKDLALPLKFVDNMLIIDRGKQHDLAGLTDLVRKHGPVDAQKYWNHFHMAARSEDLTVQRQWAYELLDVFRKKAARVRKDIILIGQLRDDGFEVEVTFWVTEGN